LQHLLSQYRWGKGVTQVQKWLTDEARKREEEYWTTLKKAISNQPVKACRK